MRIVGKTDTGILRKQNQDDFSCGVFPDGNVWAVVCDGMGGVNGGSVASSIAVQVIAEKLKSGYVGATDMAAQKKLLLDALSAGNTEVYRKSVNEPEFFGMGTTVVACIATGTSAYIAHAGDSRAYLIGERGAILLTRDHSIVQEMLESGKLSPEEAQNHPQKNIITRALGVGETLNVDFCETTLAQGSALLICTDGLTNHVDAPEIARIVRESADIETAAGELVDLANKNGGSDNITVVVIDKQL